MNERTARTSDRDDLLSRWLSRAAAEEAGDVRPRTVERGHPLPASYAQRGMLMAHEIAGRGTGYVARHAYRLRGRLDAGALERALEAVVARHETLRTTFTVVDGEPFQVVGEPYPVPLEPEEVVGAGREERERLLRERVRAVVEVPFDLESDPVLRARLYRLGADEHVLLLVVHHIANDAWSMGVLHDDLARAYAAARAGRPVGSAPLEVQYADYAQWQLERVASGALDPQLAYWRAQLAGVGRVLGLPLDRPRPAVQSFAGRWAGFSLDAGVVAGARELARREGATLFMVLMAALQVTLARWSGQDDVVVGTPVANRPAAETERMIGFFVNLLAIRSRIDERDSAAALLRQVCRATIDAYDNQEVSFERVVEELAPQRSAAHNPLIQVTLAAEHPPAVELEGLEVTPVEARPDVTRYDVAFDYWPREDGGLHFDVSHAADLFDPETVAALFERFSTTLVSMVAAPEAPLATLPAVAPREEAALLCAGCRAPVVTGARVRGGTLVERLAAAARAWPGRTAVVDGAERVDFASLAQRASALAHRLRAAGVGAEDAVAVALPRSLRFLVAAFGVLAAGGAVVPVDPALPVARRSRLLRQSGAVAVVHGAPPPEGLLDGLPALAVGEARRDALLDARPVRPGNLAYVMYTSGSTGEPKGVEVTHGAVVALLDALEAEGVAGTPPCRVAWNASPSFDASVQQWARLCRGDTVTVVSEAERTDPIDLAAHIARHQVTDLDVTPQHMELLSEPLDEALGASAMELRLLVGGEPLPPLLWSRLRRLGRALRVRAVNLYGPTETTVDATAAWVDATAEPCIGRPLAGVRVYVLDEHLRLVPPGTPGQLCVAGTGIARCYRGRPGLTAERFVPDPFAGDGSRMYLTGDRARWVGGRLQHLSRMDRQVKVRGFRIEPAEVERALEGVDGVVAAAVRAHDLAQGRALVAYCTVAAGHCAHPAALRNELARQLPAYMVPQAVVVLDRLPLTDRGKVDLAALEPPGGDAGGHGARAPSEVAPAPGPGADEPLTPIEDLIGEVWASVLGVDAVRRTDDFFDLGGHSLLAIRVIARLKRRMKLTLPMTTVFEHPTLAGLAAHVEDLISERLGAG